MPSRPTSHRNLGLTGPGLPVGSGSMGTLRESLFPHPPPPGWPSRCEVLFLMILCPVLQTRDLSSWQLRAFFSSPPRLALATMSPRPAVKLDTPVTYRLYLSHRLPPSKKGGLVGPICACRTAKTIQVPKSQQRLVLRQAIARAASLEVARHHALPPDSFTVAIDRAVVLFRRGRAEEDQNLPGVDIRGGDSWPGAEEAVRFWSHHGLAVPVWVEFYARSPPDRGHSFALPSKAAPPRGNEIAVHQALANEEAQIPRLGDTSSTASSTVIASGSTTSESSRGSSGSDDET